MINVSDNIQVWFLRHGRTCFNYDTDKYEDFVQMLCNGHDTPLDEDHGIVFDALPGRVDLVCHSPIKRAVETADVLRGTLNVGRIEQMDSLHEVYFDKNIILKSEFTNLQQIRPAILKRWYNGRNKAETFKDSLARVKEIETFLSERRENTIILITHGWFLRLLEIYFIQGKHTEITLEDILNVTPVPLGHCITATVARKERVASGPNLAPHPKNKA